jgi:ornithine carbamoyltransferase
VPVLNLESAMDHPHQGLADALTLRRTLRGKARVVVRLGAARQAAAAWPCRTPRCSPSRARATTSVLAHPEGYRARLGRHAGGARLSQAAGGSLRCSTTAARPLPARASCT